MGTVKYRRYTSLPWTDDMLCLKQGGIFKKYFYYRVFGGYPYSQTTTSFRRKPNRVTCYYLHLFFMKNKYSLTHIPAYVPRRSLGVCHKTDLHIAICLTINFSRCRKTKPNRQQWRCYDVFSTMYRTADSHFLSRP